MSNNLNSVNICASYLTNPNRRDIYFLRYQTPPFIMDDINRYYGQLLGYLGLKIPTFGDTTFNASGEILFYRIPLCRLGVFKMSLLNNTLTITLIPNIPLPEGAGFTALNPNDFIDSYSGSPDFSTFCNAIFKKVLFEQFIRQNVDVNTNAIGPFEKTFSIDVYSNRSVPPAQETAYHIDANNEHIVSFFSLTYIIPPGVFIRGPIIAPITPNLQSETDIRPFLCVAVQNGTTIGIDNEAMIHSSPPTNIPNIPQPGTTDVMQSVQTHEPPNKFIQTRPVVNENVFIVHATSTIRRAFFRLWEYKQEILTQGGVNPITFATWNNIWDNTDFRKVLEAYNDFKDEERTIAIELNATYGNPTLLAYGAIAAASKFSVGGGGDDEDNGNNSVESSPEPHVKEKATRINLVEPHEKEKEPSVNLEGEFNEEFNDTHPDNTQESQQKCININMLVDDPNKNLIFYKNEDSKFFDVDINMEGKDIAKKGGTQIKKLRKTRKNRNKNRKTKKYGNKNKKSKKNRSKKTKKLGKRNQCALAKSKCI